MSTDVVGFTTARLTTRAELLAAWLAGGSLNLYGTPRPATNGGSITTQTLLATIPLDDPAGEVENGVFEATLPDDVLALATGNAIWARLLDADDAVIADLDVGLNDSAAAVWLDNLALTEGALLTVTRFAIAEG